MMANRDWYYGHYKSYDGTVFESENDCQRHDARLTWNHLDKWMRRVRFYDTKGNKIILDGCPIDDFYSKISYCVVDSLYDLNAFNDLLYYLGVKRQYYLIIPSRNEELWPAVFYNQSNKWLYISPQIKALKKIKEEWSKKY